MIRFWYTVRSDRGVWLSGWAFGETTEEAARDAVDRELKYHPIILRQAPLKVNLQSVPNYGVVAETIWASVDIDARAHAQKAG